MANVELICNGCGATTAAPDTGVPVKCMFCGGAVQYQVPVANDSGGGSSPQLENLFKMAEAASESQNYEEAYNYYNRVLELDASNARAWAAKGLAAVWQSSLANPRTSEMLPAFKNAMKFTSDSDAKINVLDLVSEECGKAYNALCNLAANHWSEFGWEPGEIIVPSKSDAAEYRDRISTWVNEYFEFFEWFGEQEAELGDHPHSELWTLKMDHYLVEILDFVWLQARIENLDFPISAYHGGFFKDEIQVTDASSDGAKHHPWSGETHPIIWDIFGIYASVAVSRHENRDYSQFEDYIVEKYHIHDPRDLAELGTYSGSGCFIATATFEAHDKRELDILRAFRDEKLLLSSAGKRFVDWYYRNGPTLASVLSGTEITRRVTRSILLKFAHFLDD